MRQEPQNEQAQNQLLKEWRVDRPLPPRFQENVWHRIAQAESQVEISFATALKGWLAGLLPAPKLAYSYAVVLLAVGIAAGAWAAQAQNSKAELALGARYLQSIDPYQPVLAGR